MGIEREGTRQKYNRNARGYDLMEALPESLLFRRFRGRLFGLITGRQLLEVGVGTGKNMPFYPDRRIVALDFSEQMMNRARRRAHDSGVAVSLHLMDIESLGYRDASFDAVVATFVFCSVPEPNTGLSEIRRVLRPGGAFYALEHVRPTAHLAGTLFDRIAPVVFARTGVHINRNTVRSIESSGFTVEREENLFTDVFKVIVARR